uniref:G101 VD Superfamily O3 precursor conopeptide n=1 Tax=Conus geographus TaxID=6491 RepID=X5IWT2_CONGE|nr:G101_VD_Superfamily_O3_precursor_conopeptide [Conus geographus]
MSGLGIMVLTLLLLVSMAISHRYAREKQATRRDVVNIRRRSKPKTPECKRICKLEEKKCCCVRSEGPKCSRLCGLPMFC